MFFRRSNKEINNKYEINMLELDQAIWLKTGKIRNIISTIQIVNTPIWT